MKVVCDKCKKQFVIVKNLIKENCIGALITELYFNCPKCNEKFLICLQNNKCRRIQREIEEQRQLLENEWNITTNEKLIKKNKELKKEMDRINGK